MNNGWNPWHGCRKKSAGCLNCYVYRIDSKHGKDASIVTKTTDFDLPIRKNRQKSWKIPSGTTLYTCFSSDFLLEEADPWRADAWDMMKIRSDLQFLFITKRIDRLEAVLPSDWGNGYENVTICCTVENQELADFRIPIYKDLPIRRKIIICEPLLGPIDFSHWLGKWIAEISVGGESGPDARPCDYGWVEDIRNQCIENHIPFRYRQTGARLYKDGRLYRIPRRLQFSQARKAGINYVP